MKSLPASSIEPPSSLLRAGQALLLAFSYLICAFAGRFLSSEAVHFVNFWLPSGLLVACLLRQETGRWPGLLVAAFLANLGFDLLNGQSLQTGLLYATGNCLEGLTGAGLMRRLVAPQPGLTKVREVVGLVVYSSMLSTMVSATLGALVIGAKTGLGFSMETWLFWWSGDALGILLVAPLILVWPAALRRWSEWKGPAGSGEAAALWLSTGAVALFAFNDAMHPEHSLQYLVVPCVLWAAIRFGLPATALSNLFVAGLAAWTTSRGWSDIATSGLSAQGQVASLHLYLAVVATTGLLVAAGSDERNQAELTLRASEERYQLVERAVDDGIWDWNIVTNEAYIAPRWKEILGYTKDELPNAASAHFDNLHPDDQAAAREAVRRHLEENVRYAVELRLRHKDGSYRWIFTRGEAIRDETGRPVRMVGAITDITERKRATEALRESEEKFAKAFRGAPVWIVLTDVASSTVLEVNDLALKAAGYTREEVVGHSGAELGWIKAEDRAAIVQIIRDRGRVEDYEMMFRTKDERELCGLVSGELVVLGGRTCSITATVDITERKRAESALHESLAMLQGTLSAAPVGIVRVANRVVLEVNGAMARMLGYSREELVGRNTRMFYATEEEYRHSGRGYDQLAEQNKASFETLFMAKDGRIITVAINAVWFDEPHHEAGVIVAAMDITERKQAEERLAAQLDELRRWQAVMVGREFRALELKHEVNTLLTAAGRPARYPSAETSVKEGIL